MIAATVSPQTATAGVAGCWLISVRPDRTLVVGSHVRVQLPDSWHFGSQNLCRPVHSIDATQRNFVRGTVSSESAQIEFEVESETLVPSKSNRLGIDGREGRYVFVSRVTVVAGEIVAGDEVRIAYGSIHDPQGAFEPSSYCQGREPIAIEIFDAATDERVVLPVEASPQLIVNSAHASELVATLPSCVAIGVPSVLQVSALDAFGNRATTFVGEIALESLSGRLDHPVHARFDTSDEGYIEVSIVANVAGIDRLRLTTESGEGLVVTSNPIVCSTAPTDHIWWGDLHSHAHRSFDAIGNHPYDYGRRSSHLDFMALADHCERWPVGSWDALRAEIDAESVPGRFVALLGYEATFRAPWGHHNVYFRGTDGPVLGDDRGTLLDLWRALEGHSALTIPHHCGVRWGGADGNVPGGASVAVNWDDYSNDNFRTAVEIYSAHGQSELFDPHHDLAYEVVQNDLCVSTPGRHYAQDGLLAGAPLAVLASSDDHRGQPGRGECGLVATWSPALSRESVFDSIAERRCYATTGARIVLDFVLDEIVMGGHVRDRTDSVRCRVRVAGTSALATVEVLGGDRTSHAFEVVTSWEPDDLDFEVDTSLRLDERFTCVYVRVRQRDLYRGRAQMAWSSPIWLDRWPSSEEFALST